MSNTPHLKLRAYPLTLVIWEKINSSGFPYYTAKLEGKAYKDETTGEWKHAPVYDNSFADAAALFLEAHRRLKMETVGGEPEQGKVDLNQYAKSVHEEETPF